jgi:hypothetical protein
MGQICHQKLELCMQIVDSQQAALDRLTALLDDSSQRPLFHIHALAYQTYTFQHSTKLLVIRRYR